MLESAGYVPASFEGGSIMAKPAKRYVCQACGGVSHRWQGQCADCAEWNTLVEEVQAAPTAFAAKHDLRRGGRMLDAGDRGMDQGFASSPRGRGKATGPRMMEASLHPQKGHVVSVPGRKPQSLPATAVASHAPQKPQRMDVAVLPSRKPASAHAAPVTVAEAPAPRTIAPGRKPGSGNSVAQLAETGER